MKRLALILIIAPALMISCMTPQPIVKLKTMEPEYDWLHGKQVITKTMDSKTVAMKFEQVDGQYMVFDTEVLNNTNQKLLVAPDKFVIHNVGDTIKVIHEVPAIDPEKKILSLDKAYSRNAAARHNARTTSLIIGTAIIGADVAASMSDNDTPVKARARADAINATAYVTNDIQRSKDIRDYRINNERSFWASEVLRKTTLYPGESVRGYVYFPKNLEMEYFDLLIKLRGTTFRFQYHKQLIPAYSNSTGY